jgi:hypothetical protein
VQYLKDGAYLWNEDAGDEAKRAADESHTDEEGSQGDNESMCERLWRTRCSITVTRSGMRGKSGFATCAMSLKTQLTTLWWLLVTAKGTRSSFMFIVCKNGTTLYITIM